MGFDTARDKIAHAFRTRRKAFLVERKQRGYQAASRAAAAAAISVPAPVLSAPTANAPTGTDNRKDPPPQAQSQSQSRSASPGTFEEKDDWLKYLPEQP